MSMGLPTELEKLYYKYCCTVDVPKKGHIEKDLLICRRHEKSFQIITVQTI